MSAANDTLIGPAPTAQHEHYSFLDRSLMVDGRAQFVEEVRDMAQGLGLCMELVHASQFQRSQNESGTPGELPLLNEVDTERMMRFAIAAANLLTVKADRHIEMLNDRARKARAA